MVAIPFMDVLSISFSEIPNFSPIENCFVSYPSVPWTDTLHLTREVTLRKGGRKAGGDGFVALQRHLLLSIYQLDQ